MKGERPTAPPRAARPPAFSPAPASGPGRPVRRLQELGDDPWNVLLLGHPASYRALVPLQHFDGEPSSGQTGLVDPAAKQLCPAWMRRVSHPLPFSLPFQAWSCMPWVPGFLPCKKRTRTGGAPRGRARSGMPRRRGRAGEGARAAALGKRIGPGGFEPPPPVPKTGVLPLDDGPAGLYARDRLRSINSADSTRPSRASGLKRHVPGGTGI